MPQKPNRMPANRMPVPKRPGMDVITARQAAQFPGVGMTLPTYRPNTRYRPGAGPIVSKPGLWRRLRNKVTIKRVSVTLAILVLLIGGWVGGKFIYNAHKLFGGNIFSFLGTTKLKGEDEGRVNILLAGNSADDPGHQGANLTDSIMLISLDTRNHTAYMLSIPRDLWVHVPGDGHDKINDAYVVGQNNDFTGDGYPDGGMGMLEKVVSQDFGIPIDYYALVDYQALRQSVDAVGGVDITVNSSDPRGLYDPSVDYVTHGPLVKLTNGTHHLNGEQALDLARARGDAYNSYGFAGSDFDRTQHQRQLLVALKNKATTAGVLANPAKLSSLSDAIGNNVKTDFKPPEVHRLVDLVKQINNNGIKSLSLNNADGKNLLTSYTTSNGQSALIPAKGIDNYADIQAFIRRQTSSDPVVQEAAHLVVLNGTATNGLAINVKRKLTAQNFIVDNVGDALSSGQTVTTIIDASGGKKPATSAALVKQFGNHITTANPYVNTYSTADFVIVLGSDQVSSNVNGSSSQ